MELRERAYVYWYDNFGTNNQLHSARALWQPGSTAVENRRIKYGFTTPYYVGWVNDPKPPTSLAVAINDVTCYDTSYIGLAFRCQTLIDIVNIGTLEVNAHNGILT